MTSTQNPKGITNGGSMNEIEREKAIAKIATAARNAAREMLGSDVFGRYSTLVETPAGFFGVVVELNKGGDPALDVGIRAFLRAWGDKRVTVESGSVNGGTRTHTIGELFAGAMTDCTISEAADEWAKLKARL